MYFFMPPPLPRNGVLWTQKLETYLLRTESSKVLSLQPGEGQNIAVHASHTAREFFTELIFTLLVHFQNLSRVFPVLAVANTGCCVDSQNKIGHPARCQTRLM